MFLSGFDRGMEGGSWRFLYAEVNVSVGGLSTVREGIIGALKEDGEGMGREWGRPRFTQLRE